MKRMLQYYQDVDKQMLLPAIEKLYSTAKLIAVQTLNI